MLNGCIVIDQAVSGSRYRFHIYGKILFCTENERVAFCTTCSKVSFKVRSKEVSKKQL